MLPVVGHRRYREGEIFAEFSAEAEEPQKRAEGSDQRLRGWRATLVGPFEKKVSNGFCTPLPDILAERLEQICSIVGVLSESRLLHAAMGSEPIAEGGDKGRDRGLSRSRFDGANSASNEMMMEEFHSELGVIAKLSAPENGASATPKMAAERM